MNTSTHATQILLGQLAGVVAFCSVIPYIVSIFRGKTKPSRSSYAIWSVVEIVWVTSYIAAGATTTKWTGIVFAISAVLIFILSLKYGMGGLNAFDVPCLILAGIAILVWVTTKNPILADYMSTLAVFIGYLPIVKKAYLWPDTENTLSWALYAIATILTVAALTTLQPAISLRPFISMTLAIIITSLLLFPKWRYKKELVSRLSS
ncbi:MAG TPA: hypothetical protein PJ993_03590 [Candidatus Saccharibacteria bacterium]|nr:hypothetical protein [Candidatus Saccharibacteria bacterium]HMT39975.1 hypothetical protein [Candidatus Saccharibacteria bacterium]